MSRTLCLYCVGLLIVSHAVTYASPELIHLPLDQQINLTPDDPNFDAVYVNENVGSMAFIDPGMPDEWEGFFRYYLDGETSEHFKIYVGYRYTSFSSIDISHPEATLEFDIRYYRDPQTDQDPSIPVELDIRLSTFPEEGESELGGRRIKDFYYYPSDQFPHWGHAVIALADYDYQSTNFDPANVHVIRIYEKDARGGGDNYIDLKNIRFYPEGNPCTLSADMSHDCRVDLYELYLMSTQWLQSGTPGSCPFEADIAGGDCLIDFRDFEQLSGQWQQ